MFHPGNMLALMSFARMVILPCVQMAFAITT